MDSFLVTEQSEIPVTPFYVTANDSFMSGWGHSRDKINTVILPCATWTEAMAVHSLVFARQETYGVKVLDKRPEIDNDTHTYNLMSRESTPAWYPGD